MSLLSKVLSWTLGCNAVTRAAAGKQVARPSNPPPPLNGGEVGSLAEQEVQAARIFEVRRLAIQREQQALDDSRNRFLATLTSHPAMANRPIIRNDPEVKDFLSEANVDFIFPAPANHCAVSRYSAALLLNIHGNSIPAPTTTIAMAALVEGLVDRRLDDIEVQSLQQYEEIPPRRFGGGRPPLGAGITECQDPGRCPDYEVRGQERRDRFPYLRELPQYAALPCREEPDRHNRRIGLNSEVGPVMRQRVLPLLRANALRVGQIAVTRDNFVAMMEEHLRQRGKPLEPARFSAGEPLTERARTAFLPASWVTCFDGRGDQTCT